MVAHVLAGILVLGAVPADATQTVWTITASPNPSQTGFLRLFSTSCPAAGTCVAVGTYTTSTNKTLALAELATGTTWSVIPPTNPDGYTSLMSVSCPTATFCMTVGSDAAGSLAESWNGSAWTVTPTPNPGPDGNGLQAVSCTSTTQCEAVGYSTGGRGFRTLVESWNGTSWTVTPSPNPGTNNDYLDGISCTTSPSLYCAAVGAFSNSSSSQTLVESWKGTSWIGVASPPTTNSQLRAVSCTSSTACIAVGTTGSPVAPLADVWNGTSWTATPTTFGTGITWNGVTCTSPTNCIVVGQGSTTTLVWNWNGSAWSPEASAEPGTTPRLFGVACATTTACTAVGDYVQSLLDNTLVETSQTAGPPASVVVAGGSPQSAGINTAFRLPLKAKVTDASGVPVPGVTVTFAAPTTGASGTFAGNQNSAVTDSTGVATSPIFTANATAGFYRVTASVAGVTGTATFLLTNRPPPPVVSSFTPPSGPTGTGVTISGQYLAHATQVTFGGVTATITKDTTTSITTSVPGGAQTGPITVTTPSGTGTSATSFTVT
jgi:hypothetical protein